jgi:uncharacterized repeat protein (TIGR01451 family)/LPXTG-motif cell wall-anchored protein
MDSNEDRGRNGRVRGRRRPRRVGLRVGVTVLVGASLSLVVGSSLADPVDAAPGTPGTPQPPPTVFAEDFQNRPGPTPIVRLTEYSGATGQMYTADAPWLTGCNGWIASANQPTTAAGGAGAQIADCGGAQTNWNGAQQLAQALGMAAGQTAVAARDNYAVSAFTFGNPGAGLVEFQTETNIPFATANRFISFSVDVAAVFCNVSAPLMQFSLLTDDGTAIPAGTQVNACTSPTTVTVPPLGVNPSTVARVGTYTANGSVLITGNSIGVRMVNNNGSGSGNDHAFDNITILDVTPQLDKSFSPAVVGVGQSSTLTLTITNTDELASKSGWSFTDNLPAGLTIVGPAATTTCPSGAVTAPIGGSTVSVSGNLSAGMASCTVTVNVTSNTLGSFTNDASNITAAVGMSPPGSTTVTFTQQPALSIVKSSTTAMLPPLGETIPYSFLVTNIGNVTMTGIAVSDANTSGVSCPVTTLTPGTSTTCTGVHTVVQADIDAGVVSNTATVVGTPPIGPAIPPVSSNRVTILAIQLPALSIVKSTSAVTIPPVGATIPYSFLVTNTGNVTITGVTVSDPNTSGVSCPETMLAPAASTTCTGTHTVVQGDLDAGELVNTATVVGNRPDGAPIPPVPSNEVTITGVHNPALSIVKSSTSTQIPVVGATIPYMFAVTNIGNVTMTAIVVTDANTTVVSCPVTTLAPGASTTCTGSHTVVQGDIDAGEVANTATVVGTPPSGTPIPPVTSNEITIPATQNAALAIVKASPTTAILAVDQVVPYTFTVTNIGNVTMTAITVTDPDATDIFCPAFTLAPGVATICTGNHTVVQADLDAGELVNTATVVGTPPAGPPIPPVPSNEITIGVAQIESLSILKLPTTTTIPAVGATIAYEFVVTNTGNVTITGIVVTDANTSGVSCRQTTLAPGASTTCTGTHTVVQADIDAGAVVNTAAVVGTPPDGTPIPPLPSNQVTVTGTQNPALSIVKASTTTTITAAAQTVPYTFTVTNTGDVTITDIAVTDRAIGGVTCPRTTLDPGISTTCTANYTVTTDDVDNGQVVNTATVTGTPPTGPPLQPATSNTVTIPVAQSPSLRIVKSSTTTQATAAGEVVAFRFRVTNTGNVTMTDIALNDPKTEPVDCPRATLAAGAAMTCTATYTITPADVRAGQATNTATVVGTPPDGPPITPIESNQVIIEITTPTTTTTTTTTTDPVQLPATGSKTTPMLRVVPALILTGTGLLLLSRRRKRTIG